MPEPSPLSIMSFGDVAAATEAQLPPFANSIVEPSSQDPSQISLQHLARTVLKAKKVAVVCGAGISCASGIPDFRSSEGLFESLKKQYPDARLNTGKDLFDASLFASEQNASIFYTMIAELKAMADVAQPTAFHSFLKALDDEGKLFRVYTQNIDGLEEKAGLTYGLGDKSLPLPPRRATARSLGKTTSSASIVLPSASQMSKNPSHSSAYPSPAPTPPALEGSPPPAPPTHSHIPRCIPLHGHLGTMSCAHCSSTVSINSFMPLLAEGIAPICPSCETIDNARTIAGDRSRGIGRLRPDVVLYGEEHRDGERVGEITRRDLMGARPDLLLVVGTTLKVPGTKRLVRELSKVTKPVLYGKDEEDEDMEMPVASGSSTASNASASGSSSARTKKPRPPPVHVIYLNYEFPKPSTEWKDVFDVWLRGDIQAFVQAVHEEKEAGIRREEERRREKELREIRARERAKAQAEAAVAKEKMLKEKAANDKAEAKAVTKVVKEKVKAVKVEKPKAKMQPAAAAKAMKSKVEGGAKVTKKTSDKKTMATSVSVKSKTAATKLMTPQPTPPPSKVSAPVRKAPAKQVNPPPFAIEIPEYSPMKTRTTTRLSFPVTKPSLADIAGVSGKRGRA